MTRSFRHISLATSSSDFAAKNVGGGAGCDHGASP